MASKSCSPAHSPRTMPSHGVVRPRDYTSTRQLVHYNAAPPFFTGSCCYCSASRAATEYTSIVSPSRTPPSPPAALAPFNGLTKTSHTPRSLHLAHACCCCSYGHSCMRPAADSSSRPSAPLPPSNNHAMVWVSRRKCLFSQHLEPNIACDQDSDTVGDTSTVNTTGDQKEEQR